MQALFERSAGRINTRIFILRHAHTATIKLAIYLNGGYGSYPERREMTSQYRRDAECSSKV